MLRTRYCARVIALVLSGAAFIAPAFAISPDHHEFEATLYAPFQGDVRDAREFKLDFSYIDAVDPSTVAWRIELLTADSKRVLNSWRGEERLFQKRVEVVVPWDGRSAARQSLANGFYKVRLTAMAGDPLLMRTRPGTLEQRVDDALASTKDAIVQEWEVHIGAPPKIAMPAFSALPRGAGLEKSVAAIGSLPYTVYLGNLHTQSNDSDGGGAIPGCSSSQSAQSGAFGPNDGFIYARGRGLDFSAATEHNHYFDGSSNTNASANATTAKNRYIAGVTASNTYNSANPGFLALYGMEWGVIENGGHLNILNATELFGWEYNSSNELIGHTFVAKNDYAALYTTMRSKGFIGQFNHPETSTQFLVGGTALGYSADGDEVMVLAEIQNTSAFSSNTTETETGRSAYESAFKKLLERGYHVAPATNQDNHCANWGASWTNRTAVLIPNGTTLTKTSFVDALRARRVFATSDKNSQIILTANGRLMGERFGNSGPLNLVVNYANTAGRSVSQVQILEGVPGRNGTVTTLASTATHSTTPAVGEHFYYARIVQDDGKILWSAPIWVTQTTGTPSNVPPVANFTFTTSALTATFTNTSTDSDGTIASRSWNFGDGTTSTSTSPSKTFSTAGTYNVALTVTDNGGASHTATQSVTVAAAPSGTVLSNGVAKTGLSGATGSSTVYTLSVPAGATGLSFVTSGGSGDADLYVKFGSAPTTSSYDCRSWADGNAETCNIATAQAGTYHVMLSGYEAYSGLSLTGSHATGGGASFFQNTNDYTISDNATVDSPIVVTGRTGNAPSTLSVAVNIVHTYQGDIKVDLVAPDGTLYNLHNRTGAGTDNVVKTVVVNASSEVANGTWNLRVNDNASGDTGYINSWSMQF
jgi:PKD repeat protein